MSPALLSALLCVKLAPKAVGWGIPEVKALLNGVRVQSFNNPWLFLVQVCGTILSVLLIWLSDRRPTCSNGCNHGPHLEPEQKKMYDIFRVQQIMSSPVTVKPLEHAIDLVNLMKETTHHGFPVVDSEPQRFLGLVRRDQLVALLEWGIFADDTDTETDANQASGDENEERAFIANEDQLREPLSTSLESGVSHQRPSLLLSASGKT